MKQNVIDITCDEHFSYPLIYRLPPPHTHTHKHNWNRYASLCLVSLISFLIFFNLPKALKRRHQPGILTKVSEYYQEIPQSHTADQATALQGTATEH